MCENTESTEQPRTSQSMQVDKVQNFTCFSEELGLLRELDDFSGTDKGEVHGPQEEDLPLAGMALVGQGLLEVLFLFFLQ